MEQSESKELQKLYSFLQAFIYVLIILEFLIVLRFPISEPLMPILSRIAKLGIYQNIFYSKLFTFLIIVITCTGTKAKKNLNLDPTKHIIIPLTLGIILFFGSNFFHLSDWDYKFSGIRFVDILYMIFTIIGAIMANSGLDNISKMIKSNLMKDKFNIENESFEQTSNLIETKYSVNIPMEYYYNKRRNKGYINIVNPFRGTLLIGTPGSGKTFAVVNTYIRQLAAKGFALMVYDFKFPDLGKIAYYHFLKAKKSGVLPSNAEFNVINFNNVEYSRRVNPLKTEYIQVLADAMETAEALVESLKKGGGAEGGGGSEQFFSQSAINFLASCIYFFSRYENGKFSDLPHVLAFMNRSYEEIFTALYSNEELESLLSPFKSAFDKKAWDQLEGQIGTLKIQTSRLATKESFWIFTENPKEKTVNLKISDKQSPSYLVIANDPVTQSINSALNALILNRLVRLVNTKGNMPSAIIVDELPTLFFHRIANLLATARSNKVAVLLGLQELPQLRVSYGKNGADEICAVCGNVLSGSARNKETLDWLEKLFGKVKQVRENLSIDRDKTTVSMNENMDFLIPASKIANLPTGNLVGQIALDFGMNDEETFNSTSYNCKTTLPLKKIELEEKQYINCPKYYNFANTIKKEEILLANFRKINAEIAEVIASFN